jgi:hypothetical protein
MINFYKKQALLSNWINIQYNGLDLLLPTGDYHITIQSSNIKRYGSNQYIIFNSSYKVLYANGKPYFHTQPELLSIYICIQGKHAVEGRKILKSIEDTIGLGILDDTKLYEDTEFNLRVALTSINTFKFNQIGAVL